jgi:hypothetical protein
MRGAIRYFFLVAFIISVTADLPGKDKAEQASTNDSNGKANGQVTLTQAEMEAETTAIFARHRISETDFSGLFDGHSLGDALIEVGHRFTPVEISFLTDVFGSGDENSRFKKDLEEVVKSVVVSPRSVTFLPLSVAYVVRHSPESFPEVVLATDELKGGIAQPEVAKDNTFVITWDADGKPHHNPAVKCRYVSTYFDLKDSSVKRPTVDFVLLFKLRNEPSKGDEQSSIHHATLSYEYDNGKWTKISSNGLHK